jgi:hypothetical protein
MMSASDLIVQTWGALNPLGMKGLFMVLRGYLDESVSKHERVFGLSALVGIGDEWLPLAAAWDKIIEETNNDLVRQGRRKISRYHAADCSNLKNEYRGWKKEEQIVFTQALLSLLRSHPLNSLSYTIDVHALAKAVPDKDPIGSAYAICMNFLIFGIGDWLSERKAPCDTRISLLHERCDYDGLILAQFNRLVKEPAFKHSHFFTTCAPTAWEKCTPLQAADLFAYENMKDTERIFDDRRRRKTLDVLLADGSTVFRNKFIAAGNIANMKKEFLRAMELPEKKRGKVKRQDPGDFDAFSDAMDTILKADPKAVKEAMAAEQEANAKSRDEKGERKRGRKPKEVSDQKGEKK